MASTSGRRRALDSRSGGKIVRARRTASSLTPYDRPISRNSDTANPNWLSKFFYSPTRLIATGAGKLLSNFVGNDSSSSSSSSSTSSPSPSNDSGSDDLDEDEDIGDEAVCKEASDMECLPIAWKSETKRAIERLLMQETFTREECDRLTSVIKSRVVDQHIATSTESRRESEYPRSIVRSDARTPDAEARIWLEEKKSGLNSKSRLDEGTCSFNTFTLPHATDLAGDSPVDVAKSYMCSRPPWASPSANVMDYKAPSPIGMQPLTEGTPSKSTSLSKPKNKSSSTRPWNIQEELRRVRSIATDELLKKPSVSSGFSPFSLNRKGHSNISEAGEGDKMAANETIDGEIGASSKTPVVLALNATGDSKHKSSTGGVLSSNGFHSSELGVSARLDTQPESLLLDEEHVEATPSHDKQTTATGVPIVQETEAVFVTEDEAVATGSQDSSSTHQEGDLEADTDWSPPAKLKPVKARSGNSRRGRSRGRGRAK